MTAKKRRDVILAATGIAVAIVCIVWALFSGSAPQRSLVSATLPTQPVKVERTLRKGHSVDISAEPSMAGIKATRISVDFDDLEASAAFDTFSGAATFPFSADLPSHSDSDPLLFSLHLKDAPLLEGLLELAGETEYMPVEFAPDHYRFRSSANWSGGEWCTSGPFAISVERIENSVDLSHEEFAAPAASITLRIFNEPSVKILNYPAALQMESMHDDRDQPIMLVESDAQPASPSASSAPPLSPGIAFTLPLKLPSNPGKHMAIRGYAPFTMAVGYESISTKTPDESVTRSLAGIEVEIRPLTRVNGTMYTLAIRFRRGAISEDKWSRLAPLLATQRPRIFNADDQPCPVPPAVPGHAVAGDEFVLSFTVPSTVLRGDPHHLSFDFPTDIRDVRVPFEFKDLILP